MTWRKFILPGILLTVTLSIDGAAPPSPPGTPGNTVTTRNAPKTPPPDEQRRRALINSRRSFAARQKPTDDCTLLLQRVANKQVQLDNTSLTTLTRSLLRELHIPHSSQLLVFSGSASQGMKVNPHNPRALYFNDECYVGIVPGGLLEMIGVDAIGGAQLYTFQNVGRPEQPTTLLNDGCMNCHGSVHSGYAPGFFIRFSYPEITGRMTALANRLPGHHNPLDARFGGWFVTSTAGQHFPSAGQIVKDGIAVTTKVGELYDIAKHLTTSSDILAHLLHEHQIGFHNRLIKVVMSAQDNGLAGGESATTSHEQDVDELIRYILFRDETQLPKGGIIGDPQYIKDFQANRRKSRTGASLKDLNLTTRLLKHRCSYMIYTRPWRELPAEIKAELLTRLHTALQNLDHPASNHLPEFERLQILHILRDTLPDLPDDW